MNNVCPMCPCIGDLECLAATHPERFGYFCAFSASDDPDRRAHVLGHSRLGADPTYEPCNDTIEPDCPDVASQLVLIAQMKACPHWASSSTCGCGSNRCALGKGQGGVVSHADCFACLTIASASTSLHDAP